MTEQNRATSQPNPATSEQPADRGEAESELSDEQLHRVAGGINFSKIEVVY
jgi:hypothetical protein